MPIVPQHPIQRISEKDFHELDYTIMKLVFDTHNDLGRFYEEKIYQAELARRCKRSGIDVSLEFEVKLIHGDFQKPLYIDLLASGGSVYELKASSCIAEPHRIQALNYLFATETKHGKLINFRSKSVEHEFVSTQLNLDLRRNFCISDNQWSSGSHVAGLRDLAIDLLNDWGAFFDTDLYLDAICHFLGGKDCVIRDTPVSSEKTMLGRQTIPHISDTEAFYLTSVSKNIPAYESHLVRFLKHTTLESIHWINFNRLNIHFSSLSRKSFCP